jgi:hypothetical protein
MLDILLGRIKQPPFFTESGGTAILIKLDACLSQSHKYQNHATSYPVESGLNITDHIRQEPETFTIDGIVTNSPVSFLPLLTSFSTIVNGGKDRVMTAYEALLLIAGRSMYFKPQIKGDMIVSTNESKPKLVDIHANLRVFTDMIIENLTFDFDAKTGDALPFKCEAKRIRKVTTSASTINFTNDNAGSGAAGTSDQVEKAPKGVQEAPEHLESWEVTLAKKAKNGVEGLIGAITKK